MNSNGIHYIHNAPESIVSKLVKRYLLSIDRKTSLLRIFETGKFNHEPAPIPKKLDKYNAIDTHYVHNRPVWVPKPRGRKSDNYIFFSHGGGHLNNITKHHWNMIYFLQKQTNATFIVPDYPLLPKHNYKHTYEMIEDAFNQVVAPLNPTNLTFMGDSAGGAISLTLAQILRDRQATLQPKDIILITPELDAYELHKDTPKYEKHDVMLTGAIFDLISHHYVGDCPRDHFLVSPARGNLDSIGKISIFTATHDIMHPYARDFKQRLLHENREFNYFEYPKMIHVWTAITFMKEARHALRQMSNIINQSK